jgi:hypothetical protein
MGIEHNSAQDFLVTVYDLRYRVPELGRDKLHFANLVNYDQVEFMHRPAHSGNANPVQSCCVHPVFAYLVGAEYADMGQYCLLTVEGNNPEPLPYPTCPYFLGIEASGFNSCLGQGFFE